MIFWRISDVSGEPLDEPKFQLMSGGKVTSYTFIIHFRQNFVIGSSLEY